MAARSRRIAAVFAITFVIITHSIHPINACGSFSGGGIRRKQYRITTLFDSPLPINQKAQIDNLLGALKTKPIETSSPERKIEVLESDYPNPRMADCTIKVHGPSFGTNEMLHIQEVVKSQVNILVRPNSVRTVQITAA